MNSVLLVVCIKQSICGMQWPTGYCTLCSLQLGYCVLLGQDTLRLEASLHTGLKSAVPMNCVGNLLKISRSKTLGEEHV